MATSRAAASGCTILPHNLDSLTRAHASPTPESTGARAAHALLGISNAALTLGDTRPSRSIAHHGSLRYSCLPRHTRQAWLHFCFAHISYLTLISLPNSDVDDKRQYRYIGDVRPHARGGYGTHARRRLFTHFALPRWRLPCYLGAYRLIDSRYGSFLRPSG